MLWSLAIFMASHSCLDSTRCSCVELPSKKGWKRCGKRIYYQELQHLVLLRTSQVVIHVTFAIHQRCRESAPALPLHIPLYGGFTELSSVLGESHRYHIRYQILPQDAPQHVTAIKYLNYRRSAIRLSSRVSSLMLSKVCKPFSVSN